MRLKSATDPAWVDVVMGDFDAFLQDHANCERKASASALALVTAFPDKSELVEAMFELAQEELGHYHQCWRWLNKRGLTLVGFDKDPYVAELIRWIRNPEGQYFLDRLLVFGLIEARSCERLGLVAEALAPGELKDFYMDLTRAEARHHALFVRLARKYEAPHIVESRLQDLLEREAELVARMPLRPAVH